MAEKNIKKSARQKEIEREDKPVFIWEASEFLQDKKGTNWYFLIALVGVILMVLFWWQKLWTAIGVVAAAILALFMMAKIRPQKLKCSVFRQGVVINDKAYDFDSLKSFWLLYHNDQAIIRFEPQGRFQASINMPIYEVDSEQVRLFLAKHLPEDENRGEDIADIIQRWLKF